jgi:hypothetical protein
MRNLLIIAATVMALAAGGVQAKACKDANGRFAKCPAAASILPATGMTAPAKGDMAATPKKLTKADVKKELSDAQASPATLKAAPGKKGVSLMGLFKPRGAPAGASAAPMAATSTAPLATPSAPGAHPLCKKGKPCGNSCIAQNKVCHKG